MRIFNQKRNESRRRKLRKNMPPAEVFLWSKIRGKQLGGFKFRRQHGIGSYIVDFYCASAKLVVELDGESHYSDDNKRVYDKRRDGYVRSLGLRVVRFTNDQVFENVEAVCEIILRLCQDVTPSNSPSERGRT